MFVMIRERPISESLIVQQSTFPLMFSDLKLALSSKFIFKYFILFTIQETAVKILRKKS